ncbi:MAG TPA: adenylyl cyclase [Cyanobacteria bacterium UBA8803]|nr:adenylyl cyclase [Cyanobacteria bacterium UBA9273]HBL62765.1 adenylyl cyclase [Cyanobacteria bacterium UBA8803]
MSFQLISANIKNFKSLGDVKLNLRDLTILVGSNSSGKSNCLKALAFLSTMLEAGSPPPAELLPSFLRIGANEDIQFTIAVKESKKEAEYQVSISADSKITFVSREKLLVGKTKVIDIINGQGKVRDENGGNTQTYKSKAGNLALKTAGDFGKKPVTSKLAEFIGNWEFYDLDPDMMRRSNRVLIGNRIIKTEKNPSLNASGSEIQEVLEYWAENDSEKFKKVNQALSDCIGISLKLAQKEGEKTIEALEKDGLEVPLESMSDGTLRIIAYYILLNETELPPLIGIEEPERNLHPGILREVASAIKQLSKRTQVIITTHSSQLLDCFSLADINSDVSIILMSKKDNSGTQSFLLDELGKKRDDLAEWMRDFGVGSAVYHSHLLQEILIVKNI